MELQAEKQKAIEDNQNCIQNVETFIKKEGYSVAKKEMGLTKPLMNLILLQK